jgi:hypothetical protein
MNNKKFNNILVNLIIFGIGFLLMLGGQIHWLKNHNPEYISLRLIFAPILSGIILLLFKFYVKKQEQLSYFAENSNFVKRLISLNDERNRKEILVAIFFILTILIFSFSNIAFGGKTFLTSPLCSGTMPTGPYGYKGSSVDRPVQDTGASAWQNEPWAEKIRQEYASEKWPLWNPNSGVGVPLLANMQSAPFSPFRVLIYISTNPIMWDVYFLTRLFFAGIFSYCFLRLWKISPLASFVGAIVFMFSGYNIIYVNMGHLDIDVLIPAILFSFELLFRDWRPQNILFATLLVCFCVLGGMPESTFFVLLFVFLFYSFRTIMKGIEEKDNLLYYLRCYYRFLFPIFLGLVLSGPQLFLFLEYLANSWTSHSRNVGVGSNPLIGGISIIIPYFFGRIHQNWNDISSFNLGAYTGSLPVFLVLIAILGRHSGIKHQIKYFFMGFIVCFLSKYFGFFFINWIGYFPILKNMIFEKYCIPEFSFSISLLAALGIDTLVGKEITGKRILLSLFFILAIIFIYVGLKPMELFPQLQDPEKLSYVINQISIALLFTLGGSVLILLSQKRDKIKLPILYLSLLIIFELIFYIPKERAVRYRNNVEPPFVNFLRGDKDKFRVLGIDWILYPNSSSFYDIDCITDLDAMYPLRYMRFIKECLSPRIHDRFTGEELTTDLNKILRYLNLLNVKYVLSNTRLDLSIREILEKSEIIPENRWGVNATTFNINGKTKSVLFQHPPSIIRYPVFILPNDVLSFSIAMSPECWDHSKGDGVGFKIKVADGKYVREIFSRAIDPKNNRGDRRWFDYSINLNMYKNKKVNLIFETESLNNNAYDWAGWGDIFFSSKSNLQELALVYDREIKIFQNIQVFPRVFLVPNAIFAKDEENALAILKDPKIDLRRFVILEDKPETFGYSSSNRSGDDWEGSAKIIKYESNEIIIKINISKGGFLILTDLHYPGWKAYVDGGRQEILKANYLFRALYLQPGRHIIKFVYDPVSFKIGWISFFSAILILGIFFIGTRKEGRKM